MTLRPYTGNSPLRVSKDAKYSVTTGGAIRLEYHESRRVRWLLTTEDHADLAALVNVAKTELTGRAGGAFYINEFKSVLIPDGEGGACLWAGIYEGLLEFKEGPLTVSPVAPHDLRRGELWKGPHVGIPYTLNAGATDLRFDIVDGRRRETVFLSDHAGTAGARATASYISEVKGTSGGRVFINEEFELFAPVGIAGDWEYKYVGPLGEHPWFNPPSGFPVP